MARKTKAQIEEEEDLENQEDLSSEESLEEDEGEEEEDETLEEDSEALSTLHPNTRPSGSDPKSRLDVMKNILGAMASAETEDLVKWHEQTMALIGHEADQIPDGASAHNKDSVNMKPSAAVGSSQGEGTLKMPTQDDPSGHFHALAREELEVLFKSDKTLDEEAKEKITTIFEAVVQSRMIIEREEMEEAANEQLEEIVGEIKEGLEEQLNTYLTYCTEKWLQENEVAIESALRNQLMEEFMEGLRDLFAEHFIDVPVEKVDVIDALAEKIANLEEQLNEIMNENNELKGSTLENELEEVIDEVSEGLTVSQTEKLVSLAEGVEFNGDVEKFKNKLEIIKESFVQGQNKGEEDDLESVDPENPLIEERSYADPIMSSYSKIIKAGAVASGIEGTGKTN